MNLNNFTIKAQEAVQQAVQLVTKNNQQVIEPVHLLKAVIMTGESVTNFIFQKLGVNAQNLNMVLDRQIESYPKVSGGENGGSICIVGADHLGVVHGKEHRFTDIERRRRDRERVTSSNRGIA